MSSNLACQRTLPFIVSASSISTNITTSGTASKCSNRVCHAVLLFACLGIMTIVCLSVPLLFLFCVLVAFPVCKFAVGVWVSFSLPCSGSSGQCDYTKVTSYRDARKCSGNAFFILLCNTCSTGSSMVQVVAAGLGCMWGVGTHEEVRAVSGCMARVAAVARDNECSETCCMCWVALHL